MKNVFENPGQMKGSTVEKDSELEPQKVEAIEDATDEELEQFIASTEALINQQTEEILPEAEQRIESSAKGINASAEMIQTIRQEQELDQQFAEVQSEADQIAVEAKSDINTTAESEEEYPENIVEKISEITPEVRKNIEQIKSDLEELDYSVREYEELADTNGINFENKEDFQRELNVLRITKIIYYYDQLLNRLHFVNYIKDTPYIRQSFDSKETYREVEYLPKTIEVAFLVNDEYFLAKLKECASKIEKYGLLESDEIDKKKISDFRKWTNFLNVFMEAPRGNEEKVKKWLLIPSTRVSHSIFTHVTSEMALPGILDSGSIKSDNQVPSSSETGSFSSTGMANQLEKSAIYFDQNGASLNYGFSAQAAEKGYDYNKIRRIWFVTRGDRLLNQGSLDLDSFEERHPFLPDSDAEGSMFISSKKEGAEIPINEFIILIPEGADDLEQKIHRIYPGATIKTYDKSFSSYVQSSKEIDIEVMRNLSRELKDKFGSVDVPNIGISSLDFKTDNHRRSFPLTFRLQSLEKEKSEKVLEIEK